MPTASVQLAPTPPPPESAAERELERAQREIVHAQEAEATRARLIVKLHEAGMSQSEIAARLTRASRAAGGGIVETNVVSKIYRRMKAAAK